MLLRLGPIRVAVVCLLFCLVCPAPATARSAPDADEVSTARLELGIVQTVQGIVVGSAVAAPLAWMSDSPVLGVLGFLAPTIGYPVLALRGVADDLRRVDVQVMTSTTFWWTAQSMALLLWSDGPRRELAEFLGGFGLVGAAFGSHWIGYVLARRSTWTPTQVAVMNSFGLWSGVLTALASTDERRARNPNSCWWVCGPRLGMTLVATNLGLLVGAQLGAEMSIGRAAVLGIDALGVSGAVVGAVTADAGDEDRRMLLGASIGLGVGVGLVLLGVQGELFDADVARLVPTFGANGRPGLALAGRW